MSIAVRNVCRDSPVRAAASSNFKSSFSSIGTVGFFGGWCKASKAAANLSAPVIIFVLGVVAKAWVSSVAGR